jgi:hypothetical protein
MLAALARRSTATPALAVLGLLAAAVAAGAVLLGIVRAFTTPPRRATVPKPSAIVWGNRVFGNDRALAYWLSERGASYQSWAARHTAASRVISR